MKITLMKVPDDGDFCCDHPDCKNSSAYFKERKPWQSGRDTLKPGIIVAKIDCNIFGLFKDRRMLYCPDCIDLVFFEVRKTLDRNLWAFH
jgi:hypothetical protein